VEQIKLAHDAQLCIRHLRVVAQSYGKVLGLIAAQVFQPLGSHLRETHVNRGEVFEAGQFLHPGIRRFRLTEVKRGKIVKTGEAP